MHATVNTVTVSETTIPAGIVSYTISYSILSDGSAPRKITGDLQITGDANVNNVNGDITTGVTISTSPYSIDMSGTPVRVATVSTDVTFAVSNASATKATSVVLILSASGATRTLTGGTNWYWATAKPTSLTTSEKGVLTVLTTGSSATDVIASFSYLAQ